MKKLLPICCFFLAITAVSYAQKKPYSVTWQQFNIHTTPLREIGTLATQSADGRGDSRWSIGCETLDRDYADFSKYKQYVGELGVGYARIQSGWAKCEQETGKYDFTWLDKIVNGLIEEGVLPWMCLCYGNPLYGVDRNLGAGLFSEKKVMDAWLQYVRATVRHYGNRIAMWEIWNEPNLKSKNNPELYAELLIHTAEEIRKIDKDAVIIAFGLSGMPLGWTKSVMDIVQERKKLHLINYVSYHPYYPNPDNATADILALRRLVKSYSEKIDIFQGETGCPSILEYGHAMNHQEWSEYKQVKWNLRRMANDFSLNIFSSIFTMVDLQYENMLQSFGLIRMNLKKEVVYKRPAFYGVQHMANLLTTTVYPTELTLESAHTNREISLSGIADKEGKTIGAILWFSDQIPTDQLEKELVSLTISGLSLKKAVYIEPITGRIYDLSRVILRGGMSDNKVRFSNLPLWDSPILIMEQAYVPFKSTAK